LDIGLIFERRILFRPLDFRFVAMIEKRRGATVDERAKVVSGIAVSTSRSNNRKQMQSPKKPPGIRLPVDLNRRASVVRQNFRNCRGKLIHAGARHDDAVAASMSFLDDAQEFPALVLPELYVEMLALNLQFYRLDDVIHFSSRRRLYRSGSVEWKKNRRFFVQFSQRRKGLIMKGKRGFWIE
jgi:hypothetical protein